MLNAAIIGCGKIADQHVAAIERVGGCRVVAVCDSEPLMAGQLAERFGIPGVYSDAGEMLRSTRPDVVHITTPPQSHSPLATQCLQAGAHVYLEKPFTVTAGEALDLMDTARSCSRIITAGHNYQFTNEMCAMRRLVETGYLGGPACHLESHFSYDLGDTSYLAPLLGSRNHWVRRLPGQLLHNILSHGIAKLSEFLDDEIVSLHAEATESPTMLALGGRGVFDELRVMLRDRQGTSAFFCFSSEIKPGVNQLRVYGPRSSLVVDQGCGSLIRMPSRSDKSYLTYFLPPLRSAREHLGNGLRNMLGFARRRLYQDFGMVELVRRFHASARESGPPPIPYREILLTAQIMDRIFAQIYPPGATAEAAPMAGPEASAPANPTGTASGEAALGPPAPRPIPIGGVHPISR